MTDNTILFETFDEMKPFLSSAMGGFNIESLDSDLKNSLADIKIITGKELLDDLVTAYRDGTTTTEQDNLIAVIRKPLANICFYRHSNSATMNISDGGYTSEENTTAKRPYQWQIRNFQKQRLADYAAGMVELWEYLLANKADFTAWDDTDEYKNLKNRAIVTLKDWANAGRRISNWRTHYAVLPEMNIVWEDLAQFIGQDMLDDLQAHIEAGTPDTDLDALMVYVKRYVAHATIERACSTLPISVEAEGLIINEVDTTTANSDKITQDKEMLKGGAEREACKALNRMIDFLNSNATASKYESYYTPYILNKPTRTPLNQDGDKILLL